MMKTEEIQFKLLETRKEHAVNKEEIVRLRSYLATQSMKRTPQQIVEALQEAYGQFVVAVVALPDMVHHMPSDESAWSASEIAEHVYLFLSSYNAAICTVLESNQRPSDVQNRQEILPRRRNSLDKQGEFIFASAEVLKHFSTAVLQADPFAHLDITWKHFELGAMHWREWLLFARVHLLDHVRQAQQLHVPCE